MVYVRILCEINFFISSEWSKITPRLVINGDDLMDAGKHKGEWQWLTGLILTDINYLSFCRVNLQRVNREPGNSF